MPEQRDRLSAALLALRRAGELSTTRVGELSGVSQASVSRYERGKSVPSVDDLGKILDVLRPPTSQRRELVALVRDLREDPNPPARVVMARDPAGMQDRVRRIEEASAHIRGFQPVILNGLLQLPGYARAVFASGGDIPPDGQVSALTARMKRQGIMKRPGYRFTFLMPEGALRWQLGSPALMADQLDHIATVSELPGVRVGVIPWTTTVDLAPLHGFELYDERAAIVGIETATAFLTNSHDVAAYVKLFADLEAVASFDDGARAVLARVAGDYRTLL